MITAIILAAGSAKRMGTQKLLLPFGNCTIVECVMRVVKASELFDDIVVVYRDSAVRETAEKLGIRTAMNLNAHMGLSTSVIAGVKSCNADTEAYMFFSGDQPLISEEWLEALTNEYKKSKEYIIVPLYREKRGMPTIFPASFRDELLSVEGDSGGRSIIEKHREKVVFVKNDNKAAGFDIDTSEDYESALKIEILNKIE